MACQINNFVVCPPPPTKCLSPGFGLLKNGIPTHEGASSQNLVCSTMCHVSNATTVGCCIRCKCSSCSISNNAYMHICYKTHANQMSAMKHKFCTAFAKSVHVFCVSLTVTVEPAAQTFLVLANQCPVGNWCIRNFHLNL